MTPEPVVNERKEPIMSRTRIRGWRFLVTTVALVVIAVPVLTAQTSKSIPDLLGQIITQLQSLQQSLDGLTQVSESNVRVTPAVFTNESPQDLAFTCEAMNTSSDSRTVKIEVINVRNGTVAYEHTFSVPPLNFAAVTYNVDFVSCRFTVENGTRSDIRAGLERDYDEQYYLAE